MGELNAAFQRVTQEPKNVKTHYSELYELVTLCNTFISSTVLNTFIQKNKTTEASKSYRFYGGHTTQSNRNPNCIKLK